MNQHRGFPVLPILIIVLGVGWLLTAQGYLPGVNWAWSLGLAVVGVLALVRGLDKMSVVIGPFFLSAGLLSVLRQTNQLSLDTEVPLLVTLMGVLLLVARLPAVPPPQWVVKEERRFARQKAT